MNIYLNDRVIRFVKTNTEPALSSQLICRYTSDADLIAHWTDFLRYDKYLSMVIEEAEIRDVFFDHALHCTVESLAGYSKSFSALLSALKYVPAAGGLVKNELGELLFIHRFGCWDLPKGKISRKDYRDDDILSASARAAVREVIEETGIGSAEIVRLLPCSWHIYEHKEQLVIKQTFWFEMISHTRYPLTPQTDEGIFMVKWTPFKQIHCVMSHTYASLRELLLESLF